MLRLPSAPRRPLASRLALPLLAVSLLVLATGGFLAFRAWQQPTQAADAWDAGNIIDDGVFANKTAMSPGQIQAFLESKVPSCDSWGTQPSEWGGGTRRQWAEARGYSLPFRCLRDYNENGKSAAQIIYDVAQEFSINPQVFIVLLQKEQGLVTDVWPVEPQYRTATGYGCPDTAPCDTEYYGFTNQVRWAGRMFRAIMNDSPSWYTPYVLGNNFIRYNPDASCGGTNVTIQNRATQALYNYTPYQPNQGALNAGWGTAPCGAYGNRNFFLYFNQWFGSTRSQYVSLDAPRWMRVNGNVQKRNPATDQTVDGVISDGTHLRFVDKIFIDGTWYLRTAYDRDNQQNKGIPANQVGEIAYSNFATPRYMELTADSVKRIARAERDASQQVFRRGDKIRFTQKIWIAGQWHYRSEFDALNGHDFSVPASRVSEVTYQAFDQPRYLVTTTSSQRVNPATSQLSGASIGQSTELRFSSKTLINGMWYYRTVDDTTANSSLAIPASHLQEIPYLPIVGGSRWLQLRTDSNKQAPRSGQLADDIAAGIQLKVVEQITVQGQTFYRTEYDRNNNRDQAVLASVFEDIPYIALEQPRALRLTQATTKLVPKTGQPVDGPLAQGLSINFATKIQINGQWYLRSTSDSSANLDKAVPLNLLQ